MLLQRGAGQPRKMNPPRSWRNEATAPRGSPGRTNPPDTRQNKPAGHPAEQTRRTPGRTNPPDTRQNKPAGHPAEQTQPPFRRTKPRGQTAAKSTNCGEVSGAAATMPRKLPKTITFLPRPDGQMAPEGRGWRW